MFHQVAGGILLVNPVAVQSFKTSQFALVVSVGFFQRAVGGQCFGDGVVGGMAADVFQAASRGFAEDQHLGGDRLVDVAGPDFGVSAACGDQADDAHLVVLVSGAADASFALLDVYGPPGAI